MPSLSDITSGVDRPFDADGRIVPAHAALGLGRIKGAIEIERLDVVGQRDEAVPEAARHVHHQPVVLVELGAEPFEIGRRAGAQVDDHVPKRALDGAHDLHFGRGRQLIMQPAQRALGARQRIVDLDEAGLEARGGKFVLAKEPGEEAAVVAAPLKLDQIGAAEAAFRGTSCGPSP